MRKVFHVLPEGERFSELHGGAIAQWVSNILREDLSGVVVAADSDTSWLYPCEAVVPLPLMRIYGWAQRLIGSRIPWPLRKRLLRLSLRSAVKKLRPGDVVWVHNRPEFASAICAMVHRAGGTVVLHLHNLHRFAAMGEVAEELQADHIVFGSEERLAEETAESFGRQFRWTHARARYASIVERLASA